MKIKIWHIFIIGGLLNYSTSGISAVKFSPGVKVGANYCKFGSLKCGRMMELLDVNNPKYYYQIGEIFGAFLESNIGKRISIITEINITNSISKLKAYRSGYLALSQEIACRYMRIPIVMKFRSHHKYLPYWGIGFEVGHLLKAKYEYIYPVEGYYHGHKDITDQLPSIDTAVRFSLGKKINLFKSIYFVGELAAIIGLKQYEYENVGKWKNNSLQFAMGLQLN